MEAQVESAKPNNVYEKNQEDLMKTPSETKPVLKWWGGGQRAVPATTDWGKT